MSEQNWHQLGQFAPTALADARVQLHWAAQAASGFAEALCERRKDDSQSNLGWSEELGALVTRKSDSEHSAALSLADRALLLLDEHGVEVDRLVLAGESLEGALDWMTRSSRRATAMPEVEIQLRDYDMPSHPVRTGTAFAPDAQASVELARWFANGDAAFRRVEQQWSGTSRARVWPHHFDLGLLLRIDRDADADPETARTIGIGLSPGDDFIQQPYFYVNPYPRPADAELPGLAGGGVWETEAFFGAVLNGVTVVDAGDSGAQQQAVDAFLKSAIEAELTMLEAEI